MSIPRDAQERDAETGACGMLRAVWDAIAAVWRGWRAPPRHEHDANAAAEADADAKVRHALDASREKLWLVKRRGKA